MVRRLPMWLRFVVFLVLAASAVGGGMILTHSPSEALHLAAVPGFVAYVLLFRPDIPGKIRLRHVLYFLVLTGLVAAYLYAFARVGDEMAVRWSELPLAVYFLAALHIVVWLIDRLLNMTLCAVFHLGRTATLPRWRYIPKTVLRVALVIAIAGPYLMATFLTHWVKFADNTDPARQLGAKFEPVTFDALDGPRVAGWLIPTVGGWSESTVIIAPGRGLTKACYLEYARALRDNDYNVLLIDLRGEGASEGHTRSFGAAEANDVLGAVRFLKQVHPRASRHVLGLGISSGAAAMLSAAGADDRIEGVVVDSAFARVGTSLAKIVAPLPAPLARYVTFATVLVASAELGTDLFEDRPLVEVGRIARRPLLIIHGLADEVSPASEADALYDHANAPALRLKLKNVGHCQGLLMARDEYLSNVLAVYKSARTGQPLN
jgi:alpha-beta hydrolase superfamily lysophospholipase